MKVYLDKSTNFLQDEINQLKISHDENAEVKLCFFEGKLQLKFLGLERVFCDFVSPKYLKEVRQNFGRSESIYGFLRPLSKNSKLKVVDLTAGFGRDLFKFVLAGHDVTAFERNPLTYLLLKDGVKRFFESPKVEELKKIFKVCDFKIDLIYGEADVKKLTFEYVDLIYYDPMFDDLSKKTLPKKNMQMIKSITSSEDRGEKVEVIKNWISKTDNFFFKSSKLLDDFPFKVLFEKKGKGYSYYKIKS